MAINNYGVQMERLEMPIRAVSLYESAAELENTLAMANLSYLLIGAGFSTKAGKLLEKAANHSEPHENVASATAALAQQKEQEDEKGKKILAAGQKLAEFTREYGAAMIEEAFSLASTDGWMWDDGVAVNVERTDETTLKISWKIGSTDHELSAEINGRCARGRFEKKAKTDHWMSKQAEAFVILESTGVSMRVARVDADDVTIRTLHQSGSKS
jgi:hypothetical protein